MNIRWPNLLGLCTAALALFPDLVAACGLPIGVGVVRERALVVYLDGQQAITTSLDLRREAEAAAVIFPLPAPATIDQPAGGEELFAYLEAATAPEVIAEQRYVWAIPNEAGLTGGVALLNRETIGGFEVAQLQANEPTALLAWLEGNGFRPPEGALAIANAYLDDGWTFVAVRLDPGAPEGSLAPLRFTFASERLIYPVRFGSLAADPVALDLYIAADQRMDMPPLLTRFAGPISELSPPASPAVANLLGEAPFLTRLSAENLAPAAMAEDFIGRMARSNEPFREVTTAGVLVPIGGFAGPILVVVALSLAAIGGAWFIRRRMIALAEPPSEGQ